MCTVYKFNIIYIILFRGVFYNYTVHTPLHPSSLCRLEAVQTEDELSDVYTHFMLYYGRDLVAMQNKKAAERRRRRHEKQQQRLEAGVAPGEDLEEDEEKRGISVKQSHKSVAQRILS